MMHNASHPVSIRIDHVSYVYPGKGHAAVRANIDLNFDVKKGEIFGLLGPNGAGKTTLVSQLLGLLRPTSGQIWMDGIAVLQEPGKVKRLTGYLPQTGLPMRSVEVRRALYYTGRLRGQSDADAQRQTRLLLDQLGLGHYADQHVNRLSGGLLRLLNFGMALMGYPQFLILDEPTNELDPEHRRLVWDRIERLNREQGVTCVLVTHNVLEAERVVQRVAVLQKGRLIAIGTPGELKRQRDGWIRLEFRLKEDRILHNDDQIKLERFGRVEARRPGHYRVYLLQRDVANATDMLVNQIGLVGLDDFRLALPSLEDVYLEINGLEAS